jgi:thioredoxin-dependent peroxiredoxin
MLKVGGKAPAFRLKNDAGNDVSLSDYLGKRVVLFFYPKANTPGWTTEASEFRDAKKQFDKLGVVILGMSGDSVKAQATFKANQRLNFDLLSDSDLKTIEAYGSRRMKKFLGRSFLGIVRSTFLIGPEGKLEHIWDNVKAKGHAAEVLAEVSAK